MTLTHKRHHEICGAEGLEAPQDGYDARMAERRQHRRLAREVLHQPAEIILILAAETGVNNQAAGIPVGELAGEVFLDDFP